MTTFGVLALAAISAIAVAISVVAVCNKLASCFGTAPSKWSVVERKQDKKLTYYVIVDQYGNQRTFFSEGDSHICWYDLKTGSMSLEWSRHFENRERLRDIGNPMPLDKVEDDA